MTKDEAAKRWQRIEELFRGAVELPEDERAEFLDAAAGDDPELRREVDELLEADSEADDFITGAVRAGEELLTQSAEVLPPKFGKYEVESRLGEGGFGVVYRGRDPMLDRPVAIKACSSSDAGMRKRFYREARIAAGLRHANITTVHELGVEDGVPFIVQELLEGEDLRQILGEGRRLPLATAVSYLVQIARGLEHAHGAGVLHRDIKPANVRIQPDGSVKLMDFGIAKVLGADTGLTGTGMTLGTVGYLAPEQLRSEEVDERADIFAFGVLAYELLGQRRPFVGGDFSQVSYQLLYVEPSSLRERWPGCPQPLAELVHRCLHKDKLQRPGGMGPVRRMLEDLQRGLEGQPDTWIETGDIAGGSRRAEVSEPRSTTLPVGQPTSSRRRWLLAAGLAGLALTWTLIRPADPPAKVVGTAGAAGAAGTAATSPEETAPSFPSPPETAATPSPEDEAAQDEAAQDEAAQDEAAQGEAPEISTVLAGSGPDRADHREAAFDVPPMKVDAGSPGQPLSESASPRAESPSPPLPERVSVEPPVSDSSTVDDSQPALAPDPDVADAAQEAVDVASSARPPPTARAETSTTVGEENPAERSPPVGEPVSVSSEMQSPGPPAEVEDEVADTSSPSTMRHGDMITAEGPGVVPPHLLERPQPAYPPRARRRGIEQQVVVKVLVDENGGVVQVIAPGADTHGFLAAARNAAREARFDPARRDGIEGRMWVNLNFDFTLD